LPPDAVVIENVPYFLKAGERLVVLGRNQSLPAAAASTNFPLRPQKELR
jgi:hypothetical protein